jgi:hypothetical protein
MNLKRNEVELALDGNINFRVHFYLNYQTLGASLRL